MRVQIYFLLIFILAGCENKPVQDKSKVSLREIIFSDDLNTEFSNGNVSLELNFFDLNYKKLHMFSQDTILLKIPFHNQKFSNLNLDYRIGVDPVNGINVLERVSNNTFKITVNPTDTIVFDIFLSSKRSLFKTSYFKSNQIHYRTVTEVFLARKTIIPN